MYHKSINPRCSTSFPRRAARRAFTLIELLLVLVILALLAAVVVPKLTGRVEDAKIKTTKTQIGAFKTALQTFNIDNERFPTQDEGLSVLVQRPAAGADNWKSLLDSVPPDPWNHPYIYRIPGSAGKDYDIISMGPDGQEGTGDDIRN